MSGTPRVEQTRLIAIRVSDDEINALVELLRVDLVPHTGKARAVSPASRAILKMLSAFVAPPGQCMVCGCSENDPRSKPCEWLTAERTLCQDCAGQDAKAV